MTAAEPARRPMGPTAKLVYAGLVVVLAIGGCGRLPKTTPSPISSSASPSSLPTFSPSPTPALAPTASPTQLAGVTNLELDLHQISPDYTLFLDKVRSLGTEILWTAYPPQGRGHAATLYRYIPGTAGPELIHAFPEKRGWIGDIAGSNRGYALSEYDESLVGYGAWRLWYIASAGADPVLLDSSDEEGDLAPMVEMNDRYIAWTPIHGSGDEKVAELRVVSIGDLDHPLTLRSVRYGEIMFPALHGSELWYGYSEWADPDSLEHMSRVEMIDLADPAAAPQTFGEDGNAFMPAVSDRVVAWRTADPRLAGLSPGTLAVYWRDSGTIESLPIPGSLSAHDVSFPSVGKRFVAWNDEIQQRFYLYDLVEHRFRRVAEWNSSADEGVFWKSVSGSLIAFWYYPDSDHSYLYWSWLPD
jgi:hypothetical protein